MEKYMNSPLMMVNVSESNLTTRLLQLRLLGVNTVAHPLINKINDLSEGNCE